MSSEPKYRGKLPFDIIESCVTTGYNKEVTLSTLQNIEIVNLHTDEYGHLEGSPLQSPFTEKWVGGHQHRHTPLNAGNDNEQNRAEAFLINLSPNTVRVYGTTHFDPLRPRAIYSRDNLAKSPLNIKNIKTENGQIGNFSKNYEVVQTSGRIINENLIENNITASGVLATKFITGLPDYELPDNPNIGKSVFVERFSAPGDPKETSRGSLERDGEEYSPNNSLTTRNIKVRQRLYSQLTQYNEQFSASYHGANRNTLFRIEESGSNFVTASNNDNFWVQHSIPSTDLRYKWIADSNTNTDLDSLIQYQSYGGNYNKNSAFTDITFNSSSFVVSGSDKEFEIDNNWLGSIVKNKKEIDLTTNLFSITNPGLSSSFSEISNTSYGFSSWKQVRNTEHPVTRKLRDNNIVSIENNKTITINNLTLTSRRSNSVLNFTEASVTSKFKPIEEVLLLKGSEQPYKFTFTHQNNKSTFANKEISNKIGLKEDSQQMYDMFLKYSTDEFISTNPQNPLSSLEQLKYSETIYPCEVNTYLAETRGRTAYVLTQSGFTRDGYDRQLGTQRVFWRDNLEDRQRSLTGFYNSMNYFLTQSSFIITTPLVPASSNNSLGGVAAPLIMYQYIQNFKNISSINSFKTFDNTEYKNNFSDSILEIKIDPENPRKNIIATKKIDNKLSGELNKQYFLDYHYNGFELYNNKGHNILTRTGEYFVINQFDERINGQYGYASFSNYITQSNIVLNSPAPHPQYTAFIGGFESGSRSENYTNVYDLDTYDFYNNIPSGEILSTLDSGLRYDSASFANKKSWFDSYEQYSQDIKNNAKEYSIISEFRISNHMPYYVKDKGGNFRAINRAFLENDGSGIEYRTAETQTSIFNQDYIKSYIITDSSKEAQNINNDIGNLDNISFKISGIKKLLPYNGFYPQERTIQLANLFNDYMVENIEGGYFKIYEQIGGNLKTEILLNLNTASDLFYKNTVLPYFFAPGILYNTIKSGISVDFPSIVVKDGFGLQGNVEINNYRAYTQFELYNLKQYMPAGIIGTGVINSRFSFESLIFPETAIPLNTYLSKSFSDIETNEAALQLKQDFFSKSIKDTLININMDPNPYPDYISETNPLSSTARLGFGLKQSIAFAYRKNNKIINPSYSMAMSNFLAEIPRFFLKNSSMNVFRSSEVKNWKSFEPGKKYYLDIRMKKSSDLVMIESYRSEYHVTGSSNIEKTMNGRYFGWPVNKVSGSARTDEQNLVIHNDPAYAPFTPPYFEGEAILRFELSASKSKYNSVDELKQDIILTDIFPAISGVIDVNSDAYKNKMSIEDCMQIFGYAFNPVAQFDSQGNPNNLLGSTDTATQVWSISPKLETPVLDFSEQQFVEHTGSYWLSSGYGRGMWSGYGKIPTGSKGITIELAESFPLQLDLRNNRVSSMNTGSLLKQVGFTAESKKIGQLAETKQISEAIVAIPFVDGAIEGKTVYIDGHHFFAINPFILDEQKTRIELNTVENETSITRMIRSMKQYVIPPNFDFLTYYKNPKITQTNSQNIDPFVMYIFEFTHTLDQQDLSDIWQGVMPKIAITAQKDEITFSHKIGQNELFGKNFNLPSNMRWMIFKVKKKAEWNYFAVTENIADDDRFKFNFANSQVAKTPEYSYNWPYDYFSLVELAKVDVSYTFTKGQTTAETAIQQPNNSGFATIIAQQPQQNAATNNQFNVGVNTNSNVVGIEPVNKTASRRARTTNISSIRKPTIPR